MSTKTIADAIADLDNNIAQIRAQKTALRHHRKAVAQALAPLTAARAAGVLRFDPDTSVSGRGTEFLPCCVTITASTARLDSFKDAGLCDLLAHYVEAGYSVESFDNAENLNRDFKFTMRLSPAFKLEVLIFAYVKTDSPTCQKVLKSTRTEVVTHNEYEIVCS
jgi:hypothetical protein